MTYMQDVDTMEEQVPEVKGKNRAVVRYREPGDGSCRPFDGPPSGLMSPPPAGIRTGVENRIRSVGQRTPRMPVPGCLEQPGVLPPGHDRNRCRTGYAVGQQAPWSGCGLFAVAVT